MARIKFWPNKENRTVELELEVENVTINVEFDLGDANDAHLDFEDAIRIVQEDWIVK